jgi:PAS domain S-box-containing protein
MPADPPHENDAHNALAPSRSPTGPPPATPPAALSKLIALLDGMAGPCALLTGEANVVHVNPLLGRVIGADPTLLAGIALGSTGDPLGVQLRPAVLHVGETGLAATIDVVGPSKGMPGLERRFRIRLVPIPDGDRPAAYVASIGLTGDPPGSGTARLLTRLELLAASGDVLMRSSSLREGLDGLVQLTVPHLADSAMIYLTEPVLGLDGVAVCAHADAESVAAMRSAMDGWEVPVGAGAFGHVIASGDPILVTAVVDTPDAAVQELDRMLGSPDRPSSSVLVAPIKRDDRVVGLLTLRMAESQREHDETDLWIANELASRACLAMHNMVLRDQLQRRAHAANALSHVADGVMQISDGGVVEVWNPAAEAITGVAADAVIGRSAQDVLPGWSEMRERVPTNRGPAPSGRVETLAMHVLDADVVVSISGARFAGGTVYVFRDVTDDQRVESLKSDFIATVSHELRTPLASVYGAAITLQRAEVELTPQLRDELLTMIVRESERLGRMVGDILAAGSLGTGMAVVGLEEVDVVGVTREAVDHHAQLAPDNVAISLDADEPVPHGIADPAKLRQVVLNLVENAVKYSPDGGHIRVRVAACETDVRVLVIDEGIGIPHDVQRLVFDRFYRADPGQVRGISGTGLGLYICKELVRAMHGSIDVRSRPGEGSTFFFQVPRADVTRAPKAKPSS